MTTIVFDGVTLACDSRRTTDAVIDPFDSSPKFVVAKGVIFAGCGGELWVPALVDWWGSGGKYPLDNSLTGEMVAEVAVFHRKKWRSYFSDSPNPQKLSSRFALGSGSKFALAAMLCGRDAIGAVGIAVQLDPFSGGSIFYATLDELLAQGTEAIKEYKNVQVDRKSNGPAAALYARKGGGNSRAVRGRQAKPH